MAQACSAIGSLPFLQSQPWRKGPFAHALNHCCFVPSEPQTPINQGRLPTPSQQHNALCGITVFLRSDLGPGLSSWAAADSGRPVHKRSRGVATSPALLVSVHHPGSLASNTHLLLWCCSDGRCGSETGTPLSRPVASTGKEGSELPCGERGRLAGRGHTVLGTVLPLYASPLPKLDYSGVGAPKEETPPQSHPLRTRSRTVRSTSILSCCGGGG